MRAVKRFILLSVKLETEGAVSIDLSPCAKASSQMESLYGPAPCTVLVLLRELCNPAAD